MPKRQFEEGGASPPPKRGHAEQHGSCSSESESSAAREEQRQERHYIVRPDDRGDIELCGNVACPSHGALAESDGAWWWVCSDCSNQELSLIHI